LGNAGREVEGYSQVVFSGLTTIRLGQVIAEVIGGFPDLRGLWHISTPPITKYDLLVLLNEAFATGTRIHRDTRLQSDRSLASDRFWERTRLVQPSWRSMIEEFRADRTPYNDALKVAKRSA